MRPPFRILAFSLLFLPLATAVGCGASPTDGSDPSEEERLVGRWRWVRATGGIAGGERTPASEGYTMELGFGSDGVVELRRGGALEASTTWILRPPSDDAGAPARPRIEYGEPILGFPFQHLVVVDALRLVLADPCCDGFEWEFRRSS